jgi:hypothetical protein
MEVDLMMKGILNVLTPILFCIVFFAPVSGHDFMQETLPTDEFDNEFAVNTFQFVNWTIVNTDENCDNYGWVVVKSPRGTIVQIHDNPDNGILELSIVSRMRGAGTDSLDEIGNRIAKDATFQAEVRNGIATWGCYGVDQNLMGWVNNIDASYRMLTPGFISRATLLKAAELLERDVIEEFKRDHSRYNIKDYCDFPSQLIPA